MAAATDKEQEEAIPKGTEFMPGVDTDQLTAAFKKERVGKTKSMLEACLLRRQTVGIRAISERIRVSYSTVRGWLMRGWCGFAIPTGHDNQDRVCHL